MDPLGKKPYMPWQHSSEPRYLGTLYRATDKTSTRGTSGRRKRLVSKMTSVKIHLGACDFRDHHPQNLGNYITCKPVIVYLPYSEYNKKSKKIPTNHESMDTREAQDQTFRSVEALCMYTHPYCIRTCINGFIQPHKKT